MKTIPENSILGYSWAGLAGKNGLFAWAHPTAAMAEGHRKVYAEFGTHGEGPKLLVLKVKTDAKILKLTTLSRVRISGEEFTGYDLIYHEEQTSIKSGPTFKLREWVVLNPEIIAAYSADPSQLPPQIHDEMIQSIQDGFDFHPKDVFINLFFALSERERYFNSQDYRKKVVNSFLSTNSTDIPEQFRKSIQDAQGKCQYLLNENSHGNQLTTPATRSKDDH